MIGPLDADRALCALKYSQDPNVRILANAVVGNYFAQILSPVVAVQKAQQIANGTEPKS